MGKRKSNETNDKPRGPGKHAWCYYYKSESKRMKEAGVKVTTEIKNHMTTNWNKMSMQEKESWVNRYNEESVNNESWPSGLLGDQVEEKVDDKEVESKGISRCSVIRFSNMVSTFTVEQQQAVRELGFGSLLGIRCGRLRQELCRMLVKQCDAERWTITLHGTEYNLGPDTFAACMGIADGGSSIICGEDDDMGELRAKYCTSKRGIPISTVIQRLRSITTADEDFCILFCLFAIATILCPTPSAFINPSFLHALKDVNSISSKNWATWCFNFLWDGVKKVNENKTSSIRGCVLFLMIFYMSSTIYRLPSLRNGCPVILWTETEIKKFVQWQGKFGGFGSNAVPMRKESGHAESLPPSNKEVDPVTTILKRIEETLAENAKQNSEGMKLMESKIEWLSKKMDKLESSLLQLNSHGYREQARPTPEKMSVEPKFEKKEVNNVEKKTTNISSSSLDDSFKLEEKLAAAFKESITKRKPFSTRIKEESSMDILGQKAEALDSDMSLIPTRPLRNKKPGPYQLSPYDQVSTGAMLKFRAGPFLVNKAVTADHLKMIQFGFNKFAEKSEIIVRTNHQHLTRGSMLSLLPGEPINGEVICTMADYLTLRESYKRSTEQISWFLPTTFAQLALARDAQYDSFRRASQLKDHYMYDLRRCQQIFVPIHDGDFHWYLLLIKIEDKVCEIWDSLPSSRRLRKRQSQVNTILQALDVILRSYVLNTFPEPWSFLTFQVCSAVGVPTQPNGYDCGIYVVKFMDTDGLITTTTMLDSQEARLGIALQLMDSPFNDKRDEVLQLAVGDYNAQQLNSLHTPTVKPQKLKPRMAKNTTKKGRLRRKA